MAETIIMSDECYANGQFSTMKCKYGDWGCPYFEETNGQNCKPKECPEWQCYNYEEP